MGKYWVRFNASVSKNCWRQLLNPSRWPVYIINWVDYTNLPCYTLPPTQHHSFFINLPSLINLNCRMFSKKRRKEGFFALKKSNRAGPLFWSRSINHFHSERITFYLQRHRIFRQVTGYLCYTSALDTNSCSTKGIAGTISWVNILQTTESWGYARWQHCHQRKTCP